MSTSKELLFNLYTILWQQKDVLSQAPKLSMDMTTTSLDSFDVALGEKEVSAVISYLMGVPDIQKIDFDKAIDIIQTHYENQPEWKELLLSYFTYLNEKEKEVLAIEEENIVREIEEFTQNLLKNKMD